MPHKKIDPDKPFKSWDQAAELLREIGIEWIKPEQDRPQADLQMIRQITKLENKLFRTHVTKMRKKR